MAKKNELKGSGNDTVQVPDEFRSTAWVKYYPMGRDLDYTVITADAVRLVEDGKLIRRVSIEEAREMVKSRKAFIIASDTIGAISPAGYSIA